MKLRDGVLLGAAVLGVVVDQLTKAWAEASLRDRGTVTLIDGYFELRLSHNRGAFFSLGASLPSSVRAALLLAASLAALAFIVSLFLRTPAKQRMLRWALLSLGSGAIGNMIDRARYGEVTDFLHLHVREVFHWATFNVADICIAAGLGLLVADLVRGRKAAPRS